ncbi:hypothetical protein [Nocardia aurantiaca]|uniref:Uncharacterized protein n=1 Tax=Nocardia aurantiaca TaxID=2675850 RepID=A0A6I3KY21_9NOCA|nr:hypothetical protein [Nocardia aurantiaca]MTE13470.1 hypothetical protein [Nocardia aurantiaca]
MLVPLPPSWRWFQFGLTVVGAVLGAITAMRVIHVEIRCPAAESMIGGTATPG